MNLQAPTDIDLAKIVEQLNSLPERKAELARFKQLEMEVVALRRQLTPLRAESRQTNQNGNPVAAFSPTMGENSPLEFTDRRGMLKKVGALAAGVAAVGLLRPTSSGAAVSTRGKQPGVPGTTGGNFILGQTNFASGVDQTILVNQTATLAPALFRVDNFCSNFLVPPAGNLTAGLFHIDNGGGFPTSGEFHALYAVAKAPAGGTGTGIHAEGDFRGVLAIGGISGEGVNSTCDGSAKAGRWPASPTSAREATSTAGTTASRCFQIGLRSFFPPTSLEARTPWASDTAAEM